MTKSSPEIAEIVTSVRLNGSQHEALKQLAVREHRSVSQQIRHLIEQSALHNESGSGDKEAA